MKINGKYEASNLFMQQGLMLDTDKKCYARSKKLFGLFQFSSECKPLPKFNYILLFRTLYAKCESCSTEDFENSSTIQLSLVYNNNRRLIVHECKNMSESLELAKQLSDTFHLKIRDNASERGKPRWIS